MKNISTPGLLKSLLCSLAFLAFTQLSAQPMDRQQLRDCFLGSMQSKGALDSFIGKLDNIVAKSPAQECYYGICFGLRTHYADGMWSKIKLVGKAKDLIDHSIERDPRDPELRFIRVTLEHYLPSFLGMSKDIQKDLTVIFAQPVLVADSPPLKKKALEFLLATHRCSFEQDRILQLQLADLNKTQRLELAVVSSK
jgi:hypothetical protein